MKNNNDNNKTSINFKINMEISRPNKKVETPNDKNESNKLSFSTVLFLLQAATLIIKLIQMTL